MVNIQIAGLKVRGKEGTIDTLEQEIQTRIISGLGTHEDIQWFFTQYEKLQMLLDEKDQILAELSLWFGKVTVTQKLTITSDHLTTTTVADDTLITLGSPRAFAWNDPRFQDRSINIEVGTGVQPWEHIWSWKAHPRRAVQPVMDESTAEISWRKGEGMVTHVFKKPTYLQRIEWQQIGGKWKLWPMAWDIGTQVDLTQDIVLAKEAIEP